MGAWKRFTYLRLSTYCKLSKVWVGAECESIRAVGAMRRGGRPLFQFLAVLS